ncbi:trehalose-6-phosphate synthase [Thermobispora bispora]|uniref:Alpha,alpha-trehalose-phosphate synthase (UDP-forming) n=1 Tax=Thermobispora bispora (strain ATCC 19993 / DSM 43833 / CBS 139.67 / JCM 10125 / KCTC 9307 / NBRC 14880 / R51) TaxID=469371 RepID=D6Y931_THEBD|nr:trehalose-6-phosphate synthase [Thermobispora bispora]ADG89993.1 Alpha,alpha-trehalose-phosphate synthase (UDP- forming) [Thermobispora bispora DSM 43833]MBO2475782.1 trehalose-6-phosphate synthase [Actinomycetales bacterium]MDI9580395.1 trehalose-6-phosphate synthase [Thermobispora sp.]QSI46452.1 trehalose-6-phosphate synthase [Thermobispora bispora]
MSSSVLIASNRGPVSFAIAEDGSLTMARGAGGLVSGLTEAVKGTDALWICAAISEGDRYAARKAPNGRIDKGGYDITPVRMLDIPPATFDRAYNSVANSTLWYVNHLLYNTSLAPQFDTTFRREWQAYRDYNDAFATALAEEAAPWARVMVQDYHLALTPLMLREQRPDLRIAHFSHTPWAPPEYFSLLPDDVAAEVLTGILGADHAGFLTGRWASAFMDCCEVILGATVDRERRTVRYDKRTTQIGVHPLGVDGEALLARATAPDVESHMAALKDLIGDRKLIVRVDRTELSKNILRGLTAYREFLEKHPEWHGRVVHLAFAYPSRHDLPEYREYTAAVQRCAKEIEDEYATDDWDPIILHVRDDYARSLAAYRLADVLLVNPIRDGMNLVAKEGPILSERCALVLSREAGAAAELGQDSLLVNPFDISGTAAALHEALLLPETERIRRIARLRKASTAMPPRRWFEEQLAALAAR